MKETNLVYILWFMLFLELTKRLRRKPVQYLMQLIEKLTSKGKTRFINEGGFEEYVTWNLS